MKNRFNISTFNPGKKQFYLVAFVLGVIMVFMASGAAINIDEPLHYKQAQKVLDWYGSMGQDQSCLETPESNLKYYGQSPDNLSALINRVFSIENEYQTRHYIGFFFAFLLLLITGLIANEISGSYLAGILAMILLLVSPRPMGQAFGNLKDIPFAMGYAWCLLITLRLFRQMPHPSWKNSILLGLGIAFTNSVRIGGMVIFFYLALFFAAWLLVNKTTFKNDLSDTVWWRQLILKASVVFLIGYFAGLLFWPFGLINPLKNPLEALSVMEHYKISIKQIFEGAQEWSTSLPWYYLPKWLLISIPEIVWIGFAIALSFFVFKKKRISNNLFSRSLVAFTFLFPVIYVITINSNLYSGWRQMYFIYPPLVVIASFGIISLYHNARNSSQLLIAASTIILILIPVVHTLKTYPSEYIYFNSFAGFDKKAWSNYEYDYYWHEMKKAARWLEKETKKNDEKIRVASNFDVRAYLYNRKNIDFEYVHFYDKISVKWDYALLGVNYIHPYQLQHKTWKPEGIVKTFYHRGNPTVIILKGQDTDAYNGYRAFHEGDYSKAVQLLSKAHLNDSTDLNITAYLGESYLARNRYNEVQKVVQKGKQKNPFYEPFLLLEAKAEIKQNNYTEGLKKLNELVKINPRYFKALPYIIECYEKTGNTKKANQLRKKYNV